MSRLTTSTNPMVDNVIHRLLVTTDRMQRIPAVVVFFMLMALSGAVYGVWALRQNISDAVVAAVIFFGFSLLDWFGLWTLPRAQRSYGPDRPPALALALLKALLVLLIGLTGLPWLLAAAVVMALSLVAYYATWIAPFNLGVTHETLATPKWTQGTSVRMLHIGDLHVERLTRREQMLNILIAKLKPDLIVFSGDFVNISYADDTYTEAAIRNIISAWRAPLGVYCVPGTYTVESLDRVLAFVHGLDHLRLLRDEWVTIPVGSEGDTLHLLGMVTTHLLPEDQRKVTELAAQVSPEVFRLLLTHAPDVAPEADAARYDLYVCGHTHGGQIRLPVIGAVFTGSHLGRQFVMGRYDLNHVTVYTSRGVGLEGLGAPRARLLCPPEIILWEIRGTQQERRQ